jgi:hypothetical protein
MNATLTAPHSLRPFSFRRRSLQTCDAFRVAFSASRLRTLCAAFSPSLSGRLIAAKHPPVGIDRVRMHLAAGEPGGFDGETRLWRAESRQSARNAFVARGLGCSPFSRCRNLTLAPVHERVKRSFPVDSVDDGDKPRLLYFHGPNPC